MNGQVHSLTAHNTFEERLADYLLNHPDFFERHRELLPRLRLPVEDGRTVSLVERQLQSLRGQVEQQQKRLAELIRLAEDNDRLQQRLLRFACQMLAAQETQDRTRSMRQRIQQEFGLDQVIVKRRRGLEASALDPLFELQKARCGRLTETQRELIFGDAAPQIRSCAVIPLRGVAAPALLAFGSADEHRFHPGMGTEFLTRLGDIVTSALESEGKP